MPEDTKFDQKDFNQPKEFEVDELSDESLDGVAGGLSLDNPDDKIAEPGNSCINNVAHC